MTPEINDDFLDESTPETPKKRDIVIPPLSTFASRDEWIAAHFEAYLVYNKVPPPSKWHTEVWYEGPPECLPLVREEWKNRAVAQGFKRHDAHFYTRWDSPELVGAPTRPGRPEQQFGRSSCFTARIVGPSDAFPSLQDWHKALLATYVVNEQFNEDKTCVQVNYRGPRESSGLCWDLWRVKMEALDFEWPDSMMFLEPVPDPMGHFSVEHKAKLEAEARKAREAVALAEARERAAKAAGAASPDELSPQVLGAITRWSKERDNYVGGHQVYRVGDRFTVQTLDAAGQPVPIEDGPSFPSLDALRMAVRRRKVGKLPRPTGKPKAGKKLRKPKSLDVTGDEPEENWL